MRRSQTKTMFGPVRASKGSLSGMPAASQTPKSSSWTIEHDHQELRGEDERSLGDPGRHQVPVRKDDRGHRAAGDRREGQQLHQ